MSKHIVILGAGYGGLLSALTLRKYMNKDQARVTVVNQYSTHQIITELHRLAAGSIAEKAIAMPLDKLFKGKDIDLKIAKVDSFSVDSKEIKLSDGSKLSYDALVVGLGSVTAYFGIPGLDKYSMVLKSAEDANRIHQHIEDRIKAYAQTKDPADATILIGGGGLTGVELVGEIADIMPKLTAKYGVNPAEIKLLLVEAGPKILPVLPDHLIERATESLEKRGAGHIDLRFPARLTAFMEIPRNEPHGYEAEWDVKAEYPAPVQVIHKITADERSDQGGYAPYGADQSLNFGALLDPVHVSDNRKRHRHDGPCANPLDRPEYNQLLHILRKAAEQGPDHEQQRADLKNRLAAVQIADFAEHWRGDGHRQ